MSSSEHCVGVACGLLGVVVVLILVSVPLSPGVVFPQSELEKEEVAVLALDFADSGFVAVVLHAFESVVEAGWLYIESVGSMTYSQLSVVVALGSVM